MSSNSMRKKRADPAMRRNGRIVPRMTDSLRNNPVRGNEFTSAAAIARNIAVIMLKYDRTPPLLLCARIMDVIPLVSEAPPREFRNGSHSRAYPTSLALSHNKPAFPFWLLS